MILKKIISGGQSGADTAGLVIAKKFGIETGGTMPPRFRRHNDDGHIYEDPLFAKTYGLVEGEPDPSIFKRRTIKNAQDADGTVWFGKPNSPGGRLTLGYLAQRGKPYPCVNPNGMELAVWIRSNSINILNVAGNREYTNRGISEKAAAIIGEAILILKDR